MRASTLFAVILSLLIGLGAAAGARYAGLFDKKVEEPVVVQEKPVPPQVLVAAANLYEGINVTQNQVTTRPLREDEREFYNANKAKLLPAVPSAAFLRAPKKNIQADQILTNDNLADATIPPPLSPNLPADQRLVNVAVSKQKSAGGVLRVGEIVDVLLTSRVSVAGKGDALSTAVIAKGCKVIMKRDNIFTVLRSDPSDKPIEFTLQTNIYRAALIDFASYKGIISLQPAPGPAMMMTSMEDQMRIAEMTQGGYAVTDADLATLFKVTPAPAPPAPETTRLIMGSSMRTNVFPSKQLPAPGQWFSIGQPGSYSGIATVPPGSQVLNPTTGQYYDPNNKSDPNNPECISCQKKNQNAPKN